MPQGNDIFLSSKQLKLAAHVAKADLEDRGALLPRNANKYVWRAKTKASTGFATLMRTRIPTRCTIVNFAIRFSIYLDLHLGGRSIYSYEHSCRHFTQEETKTPNGSIGLNWCANKTKYDRLFVQLRLINLLIEGSPHLEDKLVISDRVAECLFCF